MSEKEKDLNTPEEMPEENAPAAEAEQAPQEAPNPLEEELAALKAGLAEQEDRSLSSYINLVLRAHLEELERKADP